MLYLAELCHLLYRRWGKTVMVQSPALSIPALSLSEPLIIARHSDNQGITQSLGSRGLRITKISANLPTVVSQELARYIILTTL